MLHPEVICALFPFDACYMKSNNSGGQQSAILQVHWADRGIFALESRVGQWSWNTSDYFQFFFIMLFVYDMVKKVFFSVYKAHWTSNPPAPSHFRSVKQFFFYLGFLTSKSTFHTQRIFVFRMALFTPSTKLFWRTSWHHNTYITVPKPTCFGTPTKYSAYDNSNFGVTTWFA